MFNVQFPAWGLSPGRGIIPVLVMVSSWKGPAHKMALS